MSARGRMLGAVVSLVLATGLDRPASAQQNAPPPAGPRAAAIVIVDGSNSMNARLPNDRAPKFVTVREALRAALPKLRPGDEIGLAAFGARRASDCRDVAIMVPPTAGGAGVTAALERFQPRGFSPVVLALRTAAATLPKDAAKASLVLVLDDLASCRADPPCQVAAELKRQNPALAIHVVGLALRQSDSQVLACVAQQTGGELIHAPDGPSVGPAIERALALASLDQREAPQEAQTVEPERPVASRPAAPPAIGIDVTQPGLHLTARLAEGAPTLLLPIQWRIWQAEAAPRTTDTGSTIQRNRNAQPLAEVTAPAVTQRLANGRYDIEARAGLVVARRSVEITSPGPMPVVVDLDGGLLTIAAPQVKGGTPPADTIVTVLAFGSVGDPRDVAGTPLWISRGGLHDLIVPAGSYRVRATAGLASAERVVTIGQGIAAEIDLPLLSGRLVVEERPLPGQQPAGTPQIVLEADDPDTTAGRRELYRAAAARLELTVPAGSYILTVRRGAVEARERVLVKPADTVTRAVSLAAARVRLVSRIGSGLPPGLQISYRIERLDPPVQVVAQRWGEPELVIDLSPGRYRFQAQIGQQNAVAVRDFELRGGPGEARIDLDTGAGGIRLRLAGANAGLGLGEVYWQISTERGEAVWRTGQAEPMLALGAGRYRVRADVSDKVHERTFEVRAGENRVLEVGG